MKVTIFMATSLDGFIARPDGSIDWLEQASQKAKGEDFGYEQLMTEVDALVMGRRTFETVLGFPEWPYVGMRVIVLSQSMSKIPAPLATQAELSSEGIEALLEKLEGEGLKHLYVDGGQVAHSFLRKGRVTEMVLTQVPVLIGSGRRLFGELDQDLPLELISAKPYPSGLVRLHYRMLPFSQPQ